MSEKRSLGQEIVDGLREAIEDPSSLRSTVVRKAWVVQHPRRGYLANVNLVLFDEDVFKAVKLGSNKNSSWLASAIEGCKAVPMTFTAREGHDDDD